MKSLLVVLFCCAGAAMARVELQWAPPFSIPPVQGEQENPGVARPYAGEHNGVVLMAGGANFPDVPLVKGGRKVYQDTIYLFNPSDKTPEWKVVGHLPKPMAEGASITTPVGIVCVGGSVGRDGSEVTASSFLMKWDISKQKVIFDSLPDFPYPVRMPAMAVHGTTVYVAGGSGSEKCETSDVWQLDLSASKQQWEALPRLPELTDQPVAAIQNLSHQRTALFVFGGMRKNAPRIAQKGGWFLTLFPTATNAWADVPEISVRGRPRAAGRTMIGASALPMGGQHILIFGGSDRVVWDTQAYSNFYLKGSALRQYRKGYFNRPSEAFAFGDFVLAYHTVTGKWFDLGKPPFSGRCGAAVLRLRDGRVLLTNGEIGPGIRTPQGALGTFERTARFHPINLLVIIVYLAGMALLGLYFMHRNKSSDDYFRGGGRLPWWAVSMSLYATMFSSITFLSIPAMSYLSDCKYFVISFGIIILAPIVTHFYLPFFRKLDLTSAYEYLEKRFNLTCRLFASAAFTLFMVARTAIVTYLPAIALSAVINIDVNVAIVVVTVITILYCAAGGIEAVIWSDFIQSMILIFGTACMFIYMLCGTDGGIGGFFSIGMAADKFRVFDFVLDWTQPGFWVVFFGGVVANLASYTSDQCVVQRYMTTSDEKGAAKSIICNGVMSFVNCIVFFLLGVALYTFYHSHPGLLDVTMPKNDSIFPLFIGNDLPVGLSGLILAAVAAATMSTLSSNLNSSATAVTTDFYARLFPGVTEKGKMRCGQIVTVLTGLLGGGFALVLANMEIYSIYDQFQRFLGILTGGLGCLFLMGIFLKRVNGPGAIAGLVANYVVCIGLDRLPIPGKPHMVFFGTVGLVVCLIVALLVSPFFPSDETKTKGLCWARRKKEQESK